MICRGGAARFMGWEPDEVVLSPTGQSTVQGQSFLFVGDWLAGFATDSPFNPRAEILVGRGGDGQGDAWMNSSGGAEVRVDASGDVVITLGN